MNIDFSREGTHILATHASNGAILGSGRNERRALIDVLTSVHRAFINLGHPNSAKDVMGAIDSINRRISSHPLCAEEHDPLTLPPYASPA